MKRFLIHISTAWCGMNNTFRAIAESGCDLYDISQDLAYESFQSYGCNFYIAEAYKIKNAVDNGQLSLF